MIRVKRGVKEDLPTLYPGEPGMCLDDGDFYVGANHGNIRINGPWVTPEAYGAKGDGLTDSTSGIQAAINTGRPVLLHGDYVISDTLTLPENTNLIGTSTLVDYRTGSRFKATASITINKLNTDILKLDPADLYLGYVWSVKIANLKLVGHNPGVETNTSGCGLNLATGAFTEVSNVSVDGTFNGLYIDTAMSCAYKDMDISRCDNACIYLDGTAATTTQVFNNVVMRESPYGLISKASAPGTGCFNPVFEDCLIESTDTGGVVLEYGCGATFNNLYTENVPRDPGSVAGCIFECGLDGAGSFSRSVLNLNGGSVGGSAGPTGAIFRTENYFLININGGQYFNATLFHEQIALTGAEITCAINLNGTSVVDCGLHETFDTNSQLHGSFIDGALPATEWFRNKVRLYPTLTANSITTGTIAERLATLTNLSATVPNGTCDGDTGGVVDNWEADRATLAIVAGGESGDCLEITHVAEEAPNAAAHQVVTGLVPGIDYTISAYVKSGTSGDGAYGIGIYPKVAYLPILDIAGTSSGAWVEAADTFTNPAGNADVWIYLVKNNVTAGTMLFDTVTLTASAPASVADGYVQYSGDIAAGNSAPHFRTENGRVVKLYQQDRIQDPAETTAANTTAIAAILALLENTGLMSDGINGAGSISAVSTFSASGTVT
jgi:hypothetical protein